MEELSVPDPKLGRKRSTVRMNISINKEKIADFCQRWQITELSLFGSVLRDDFRPDSDVDVLVSFLPDAHWSLFDLVQMQEELTDILRREVDLVEKKGLRNPFRRHEILRTRQVVYGGLMPRRGLFVGHAGSGKIDSAGPGEAGHRPLGPSSHASHSSH